MIDANIITAEEVIERIDGMIAHLPQPLQTPELIEQMRIFKIGIRDYHP